MKPSNLTDLVRGLLYRGRPVEEVQAKAQNAKPHRLGLQTDWREGMSGSVMRGRDSRVVHLPTVNEVESFGSSDPITTCGSCRYFSLKHGQERMVKEGFADVLVQDMDWKLKHLCAPLEALGSCDQDETLVTSVVSKSCDRYREHPSRAGRWRLGA